MTNAQHFLLASQICAKLVLPRNPLRVKRVKYHEPSLWTARQFVTNPSFIPCHCLGRYRVLFYTFANLSPKLHILSYNCINGNFENSANQVGLFFSEDDVLLTVLNLSKCARIQTFNFGGIFLLYVKYAHNF